MKKHKDKIILSLMILWVCISLCSISIIGTEIMNESGLLSMLFVVVSVASSAIPFLIFMKKLEDKLENQIK